MSGANDWKKNADYKLKTITVIIFLDHIFTLILTSREISKHLIAVFML